MIGEEEFVRLEVLELNRVAEAIATAGGEYFNEYTAPRYRSLARVAVSHSAACISERMAVLPSGGRHTRASWMVAVLAGIADVDVDELDSADEAKWS